MKFKKTLGVISILLAALVAVTGCSEPKSEVPGSATLTVSVEDGTGAKTITPEGNVDVSHYVITVRNEAEDMEEVSSMLEKGRSFIVTNIPEGVWSAQVDAYVENDAADGGYVLVATATSDDTRVVAGQDASIVVTLDSLSDSLSGDVSVTLRLPSELDDMGDTWYYTYSIAGTGQRSGWSYSMDTPVQGTTGDDGCGTFTIDADAVGLMQGSYLLSVTVGDQADEDASVVVRKGVEIMRLVNGLEAAGTVSLDSQIISEEGFVVAITDRIGDMIDLGTASWNGDDMNIVVSYSGDAVIDVYVDGLPAQADADYEVSVGTGDIAFLFPGMETGRHMVTFIADESGTELGVGSLTVEVFVPYAFTFTPVLPDDLEPDVSDIYEGGQVSIASPVDAGASAYTMETTTTSYDGEGEAYVQQHSLQEHPSGAMGYNTLVLKVSEGNVYLKAGQSITMMLAPGQMTPEAENIDLVMLDQTMYVRDGSPYQQIYPDATTAGFDTLAAEVAAFYQTPTSAQHVQTSFSGTDCDVMLSDGTTVKAAIVQTQEMLATAQGSIGMKTCTITFETPYEGISSVSYAILYEGGTAPSEAKCMVVRDGVLTTYVIDVEEAVWLV